MNAGEVLVVEVVHALPGRAVIRSFKLAAGATVADVLELAAGHPDFAGIDVRGASLAIFGRVALRESVLEDGDRVEILRPLAIDPKDARRARARAARRRSGSGA